MYRTFDFKCKECGNRVAVLVASGDENSPIGCTKCPGEMMRTLSVPHIRTAKSSVSFVDGQRKQTKEWAELRTQGKLEDAVFDAPDVASKTEAVRELNTFVKKGN